MRRSCEHALVHGRQVRRVAVRPVAVLWLQHTTQTLVASLWRQTVATLPGLQGKVWQGCGHAGLPQARPYDSHWAPTLEYGNLVRMK